jgi:NADPH:quinone reductase-like Zn-dependent oxidoreductase
MKAARIHKFGGPEVIVIDELDRPNPAPGEVLVRVAAAGVGPWDALVREGRSAVPSPFPLTLGSDLSGTVEAVGRGVSNFQPGEAVYGATNKQFIGAYGEYALASAEKIASKPKSLDFLEAASVPVVAVTAWQMLFEYADAKPGQTVLVHGAAGNVGAYAVQLARHAGLRVFATAGSKDAEYVRELGASVVIDYHTKSFEQFVPQVDLVLDMVGGDTREGSYALIKTGGILVSIVSPAMAKPDGIRAVFFLADVTTARLDRLSKLFDNRKLVTQVGSVLPLQEARVAHEMLGGAPHKRGKIVLGNR